MHHYKYWGMVVWLSCSLALAAQGAGTITSHTSVPYLRLENGNDALLIDNATLRLTDDSFASQLIGGQSTVLLSNNAQIIVPFNQSIELVGSGSKLDLGTQGNLFSNLGGSAMVAMLGEDSALKIKGQAVYQTGKNINSGDRLAVFGQEVYTDAIPPQFMGEFAIRALNRWRGAAGALKNNTRTYYYYQRPGDRNDDIIHLVATLDSNDYEVKGCYHSLVVPPTADHAPTWDGPYCVLGKSLGNNEYQIDIDLEGLTIRNDGPVYPITVMAQDQAHNTIISDGKNGRPAPFQAVINFNPSTWPEYGSDTTDWSEIDDFTAVTNLRFTYYQGSKTEAANRRSQLTFQQSINLCADDLVTNLAQWKKFFLMTNDSVLIDDSLAAAKPLAKPALWEVFNIKTADFEPAVWYQNLKDGSNKITTTGLGKDNYLSWSWDKVGGTVKFLVFEWGKYTVDALRPTAPAAPTVVGLAPDSITLKLGAGSSDQNLKEYRLYFMKGSSTEVSPDELVGATIPADKYVVGEKITVKQLEADRPYSLALYAIDQVGNQAVSSVLTATTTKSGTIGEQEIQDYNQKLAAEKLAEANKKWIFGREAANPYNLSNLINTYANYKGDWSQVDILIERIDHDGIQIQKIGNYRGVIPFNIMLRDSTNNLSVKWAANTKLTYPDGQPYVSTIITPRLADKFKSEEGLKFYRGIYLGPVDKTIKLSQSYTLRLPFTNLAITPSEKYQVYYFDEARQKYILEGTGGKLGFDEERNYVLEVHPMRMGLFVLAEKVATASGSTLPTNTTPTTPTTTPTTPVSPTAPCVDLCDLKGHWSEKYVRDLVARGIMSGYADGHFYPDAPLPRDQMAKFIAKAFGLTAPRRLANFSDSPTTSWYDPYVQALYYHKIIQGFDDNTFRPTVLLKRYEFIKLAVSAIKPPLPAKTKSYFTDVPFNKWYRPYIVWAENNGVLQKKSRILGAGLNITRGEAAKIIYLLRQIKGLS